MDLSSTGIIDHHCHALRRFDHPLPADEFRAFFAETTDPAMPPHIARTVFYMRMVRDVAALLGCEATEDALLKLRNSTPLEDYARRLFDAGNWRALFIDTGYKSPDSYTVRAMSEVTGRPTAEVLRLETQMEDLIASNTSLRQVEEALREAVRDSRSQGIVGLKSIAAYRGGLQVERRTFDEANAVFPRLKELAGRHGHVRLSDRAMLDYLLRAAIEEAAAIEMPVQFHVAFGDDDADLRTANPLHLRNLLTDPAFRRVPFVLLHCYPYVREAGYLAALYAHVFVDVSLTMPLTAHGSTAAFSEVLELAPVSKVLFATDAHSMPELFYAGALHGRHALGHVLDRLVADQMISPAQAAEAAEDILWRNSSRLYRF
jgi:predicted TIM-barrel fold metal-dependent hydrolase